MPKIYLSPSTQDWNMYVTGSGSEEYNMNLLADALVPYLLSNGIQYQRNRPEKAPQLHSFLSYYLPTTLKILRAYSQLEDQEVSGENITSAMERIEGMMDKVVEGFEKQLDLLFQGDAMDITTDVEVLERMLAKDGLSGQEGMTLGL